MYKILRQAGIKNYGIESCINFIRRCNYKNVGDFLLQPVYEVAEPLRDYISDIQTFADAVQFFNIPGLKENIRKLTENYNSLDSLLAEAESNIDYIWGLFDNVYGEGITNDKLVETFISHLEDFYVIPKVFTGIGDIPDDIEMHSFNICISESVQSKYLYNQGITNVSKEEFVKILNSNFKKHGFSFTEKKSVTRDVDFVVHDGTRMTTKARAGKERGILITSDNLISWVLHIIKERSK